MDVYGAVRKASTLICKCTEFWRLYASLETWWVPLVGGLEAMDPAAVEEFRKLEQEKNRLEAEIKTLYEYLTEDGCWANLGAMFIDVHIAGKG